MKTLSTSKRNQNTAFFSVFNRLKVIVPLIVLALLSLSGHNAYAAPNQAPVMLDQDFTVPAYSSNGTVIGNLSATDIDGDTLLYVLLLNNVDGFVLSNIDANGPVDFDPATGELTIQDATAFYNSGDTVKLIAGVIESNTVDSLTAIASVNVIITPGNQPPVINAQSISMPEDQATNIVFGNVTATDPNPGQSLTYVITAGNDDNIFSINFNTGDIDVIDNALINFENTQSYDLTVQVQDDGTPVLQSSAVVTIAVQDVNEAPVVADATFDVNENTANGTSVATVVASDVDQGQSLTYTITGGTGVGVFDIDGSTGEITVLDVASLNYEVTTSFDLTVQVTDDGVGSLTDDATITIDVNNVNDAPVIPDFTFSVGENSPNGTIVGSVTASDEDAGTILTGAIISGNDDGAFELNLTTGEISIVDESVLDYETVPQHIIVGEVSDGDLTDVSTITINLTDMNDEPVILNQVLDVDENSTNGTLIGQVMASDPDAGQGVTFAITAGNNANGFSIDQNSGELFVDDASALDFETTTVFYLTVEVTDNDISPLSRNAIVTVDINDVNEAPVATDASFTIDENVALGTAVGTVQATDVDAGQQLGYAIINGNTGAAFDIDGLTGEITVAGALDFETLSSYSLTVSVFDNGKGNITDEATIDITVNDMNDAPSVADFTFTIDELSANGTFVGKVSGTDVDAGQTLAYTITAGNTNGEFDIDDATGDITVNNGAALDYELGNPVVLTITATDDGTGQLTDDATVTINLNDVNEAPVLSDVTLTLAENSASNTLVGVLQGVEVDAGQTITYTIVSGNAQAFELDAANGKLKVLDGSWLDFETTPSFQLVVEVEDDEKPSLSSTGTVTVELTDVNEAPAMTAASFTIDEHAAVNTTVGTVAATDVDAFQTLTYTLVSGNTNGAFAVKSATGEIVVLSPGSVDHETTPSFTLRLRATDDGTPSLSTEVDVTIDVTNLNEAPVVAPSTFTVSENSANGTTVGVITATDDDQGQSLTYAWANPLADNPFSLHPTNGTVKVVDASLLDFENSPVINLTVEVTDNGTPAQASQAAVTVNITDINEVPVVGTVIRVMDEDGTLSFIASDFTAVFNDQDGDQLDKIKIQNLPANGTLTLGGQNVIKGTEIGVASISNLVYTPDANYFGTEVITWNGNDGVAYADEDGEIRITVESINDMPFVIGTITDINVDEDAAAITSHVDLRTVFDDVEHGSSMGYRLVSNSNPALANVKVNDGVVEVEFNEHANGTATIEVSATDFSPNSVSETFTISVNPIDDVPGAFDLSSPFAGTVLDPTSLTDIQFNWTTAEDVDGDGITYTLRITGDNTDLTFNNLTSTTFQWNGEGVLQPGDDYEWFVLADDGRTVVNSGHTFGFKVSDNISTGIFDLGEIEGFELKEGFPNPFTNSTTLGYVLPQEMQVTVKVFSSIGEEVITLVNDRQSAGEYKVTWGGQDAANRTVSAGKYIYQVTVTDLSGKEVARRSGKLMKF